MTKTTLKKTAAAAVALLSAFSIAGCSSSSGKNETTETTVETVKVEDTDEIDAIPDDAEKEIRWLGTYDLNPSKGQDKTVEMTLFNNKAAR